jgi:hypothetical protein
MSGIAKSVGKLAGSFVSGITGSDDVKKAANKAAAAQTEAARLGATASAFRPVGMTTRFGSSQFGIEDVGGVPRVTSAGYQLSPELQAFQDYLMGLSPGALGYAGQSQQAAMPIGQAAQGLFGLGQQYLAMSPEQARQQYMQEQYAMLDPIRAREEQRLGASVFGRGRAGLNVGDMGQPELFALASARRGQDLQLAAQAEQAAQQRAQFGAGLFGTGSQLLGQQYGLQTEALGPLQGLLGTIGSIEELGQQPFQLGLQVGGAAQPGATAGATLLSSGLQQAAQTRLAGITSANQMNAELLAAAAKAAATSAGSDINIKENIQKIGKLSNGLNLYSFEYKPEYKNHEYNGHGKFIGVMAQEVEKIIPEAVSTSAYGYKVVDYSLI